MRGGIKDRGRMNVDMKPPIPGLTPRPPPPLAADLETHLPPHADGSPIHACPSCTPLREALRQAYDQILSAQTRINSAIILGKEAIERSMARVGAYEILERIHRDHGIPFQDGCPLPEEYTKHFPLHKYEDGIEKGAQGRAAMQSPSFDGSHSHQGHHADTSTLSNESTEESDESFPPGYTPPRSSEQSGDESSENPWNGESDNNRDWEMDPQALSGSDIGPASGEDNDDHLGLEEEKEGKECDEESDENGVDQDEDNEDGSDEDEDDEDGSDEDKDEQSGE